MERATEAASPADANSSAWCWTQLGDLSFKSGQLAAARQQLVQVQLVAYQKPLYQVLALDSAPLLPEGNRVSQTQSVADILCRVLQAKKETGETP